MRGRFWIIAVDVAGLSLLAALVMGGVKTSLFGAVMIAVPLAMLALMAAPPHDHEG
jgi:hypothetical protein